MRRGREAAERRGRANVARSNLESSPGEVLRIIVGKWSDVRKDIASRQLEEGPEVSGVFAKPSPAGNSIALMDADGKTEQTLGPGSGLVAATCYEEEHPTWLITGTDDVGVAAAAAAMTEDQLRFHFALAIDAGRGVPLPLEGREVAPAPRHPGRRGWSVVPRPRCGADLLRAPGWCCSRCWRSRSSIARTAGSGASCARPRAGASVRVHGDGGQRARLARRGDGDLPRAERALGGPARLHARGAGLRRRAGLRILAIFGAAIFLTAAVDNDELLRALRRVSLRSA